MTHSRTRGCTGRVSGAGKVPASTVNSIARAFQTWVKRGDLVVVHGALLLTAAVTQIEGASTTRNANPSVDRSRSRSRIDALQAALLSIGLAERYRAAGRRAAAAGSIGHYAFA